MTKAWTLLMTAGFVFSFACNAGAQARDHTFARFADGRLPDGTFFKSTLSVVPKSKMDPVVCSFNVRGGAFGFFDDGTSGSSLVTSIPAGGFWFKRTTGGANFQGGYATVSCDGLVYATLVYTYFSQSGAVLGEAAVFSPITLSDESVFLFDHAGGSLYGIALANDTDQARVYDVTATGSFGTRTTSVVAGARGIWVGILQDIVSLPAGARGIVRIQTRDFAAHAGVALRFTGNTFTTVPAQ